MRTIESVVEELQQTQRHLDSLCGYDEGQPVGLVKPSIRWADSPLRCSFSAVWHLKAGTPPEHMMLQSCDRHFAMCVQLVRSTTQELSIHEYGSACGLPGTFWLNDYNICATQDSMWDLGLLYTIHSEIQSEHDPRRCHCHCPACRTWMHITGECDRAIDSLGYSHMNYTKLTMQERTN